MCRLIAVTNRKLCRGDFLKQIEIMAKSGIDAIILREKDLRKEEYQALARQVKEICDKYPVRFVYHTFVDVAMEDKVLQIHLPLPMALQEKEKLGYFLEVGCSTHSIEDVRQVEELQEWCREKGHPTKFYVTLGHIFETDCKKGLPPKGLSLLKETCRRTKLPVYAIGGITPENMSQAFAAGAQGVCLMSWCMNATAPMAEAFIQKMEERMEV